MASNYRELEFSGKHYFCTQKPERQHIAIQEYVAANAVKIDRVYEDRASGRFFQRPQYQAMKGTLRAGDIVILKELDRMGRDMVQIKQEWHDLQSMGVDIIVTDTPMLNTANKTDLEKRMIANIVFELLAYMAEKERQKILARQAEGITIAKRAGKYRGRTPLQRDNFNEVYTDWKAGKITAVKAMEQLNLSKATFYRRVKQFERTAKP